MHYRATPERARWAPSRPVVSSTPSGRPARSASSSPPRGSRSRPPCSPCRAGRSPPGPVNVIERFDVDPRSCVGRFTASGPMTSRGWHRRLRGGSGGGTFNSRGVGVLGRTRSGLRQHARLLPRHRFGHRHAVGTRRLIPGRRAGAPAVAVRHGSDVVPPARRDRRRLWTRLITSAADRPSTVAPRTSHQLSRRGTGSETSRATEGSVRR